jgi:hypothetical protein
MATKADLNLFVADRLEQLRGDLLGFNLQMDKLTFIARDSNNDEMIVCVSNESPEGLKAACQLAIKNDPVNIWTGKPR